MTTFGVAQKKEDYPRLELVGKGKLILTRELQGQIDWLHDKVGNYEWIGILLYTKEEGDISDPNSLVLKAHKFYPMDIGTAGHTQATINADDIVDMYDRVPDAMELKQGLIHTHHSMETFFSAEDWSELNDNTPLHNYYLSLIVNFKGSYTAKVAYMANMSTAYAFNDCEDQPVVSKNEKKVLMTINMDIVKEGTEIDELFETRYEELRKSKVVVTTYTSYPYYATPAVGGAHYPTGKKPDQGEVDQKEKTFRREDRHYTSFQGNTLTYHQAVQLTIDWLNEGYKVVLGKEDTCKFDTVTEGLALLQEHYRGKLSSKEFSDFSKKMQDILVDITEDYQPSVTSKRISVLLRDYQFANATSILATTLASLAEKHPIHVAAGRKEGRKKEVKEEKEILDMYDEYPEAWNIM